MFTFATFLLEIRCPISNHPHGTHHQDLIILGVGYLWEAMVVFMGMEDHQEREMDLWEEVVDLQAKANP